MFINAKGEQWNAGSLWFSRVRYAFDVNNKVFSGLDLDWFENRIGQLHHAFIRSIGGSTRMGEIIVFISWCWEKATLCNLQLCESEIALSCSRLVDGSPAVYTNGWYI